MARDKRQQILAKIRRCGMLRPRDLQTAGISGEYLNKLYVEGLLDRPARGLYTLANDEPTENRTLAQACKQVPGGIVCLLSALRFHDLTTESPFQVWMAIGEKARLPRIEYPPLRFVRFSDITLRFGVKEHTVEGTVVRVYNPAKTVVDCFKYRNKIGLELALEALRDCWRQRKATMDELWKAAKVCRMSNVMRPYLEMLT
jgi:predicted transcriptional regulator of viral defense system